MILEDMPRIYVMHQHRRREEYIPLLEFSYNNGYQESLRTSQFEAIYRQSYNTPIRWSDQVKKVFLGLNMFEKM